jgi:hypothetical protein
VVTKQFLGKHHSFPTVLPWKLQSLGNDWGNGVSLAIAFPWKRLGERGGVSLLIPFVWKRFGEESVVEPTIA